MPLSFQVTGAEKNQLVVSLAAILLSDSGLEVTAGLILQFLHFLWYIA